MGLSIWFNEFFNSLEVVKNEDDEYPQYSMIFRLKNAKRVVTLDELARNKACPYEKGLNWAIRSTTFPESRFALKGPNILKNYILSLILTKTLIYLFLVIAWGNQEHGWNHLIIPN